MENEVMVKEKAASTSKLSAIRNKMSYAKAEAIIGASALAFNVIPTYAETKVNSLIENILTAVFGPAGKILGGLFIGVGIFKLVEAQADDDARANKTAFKWIAIGVVLFFAGDIIKNSGLLNALPGNSIGGNMSFGTPSN